MPDITRADGFGPTRPGDDQPALGVHAGGLAGGQLTGGPFDPDVTADGRAEPQVGGPEPAGLGVAGRLGPGPGLVSAPELLQHRCEQRGAVQTGGAGQVQGGRGQAAGAGVGQLGLGGGHVQAEADDDRVAGLLGQDAGQLALTGQQVVRPLQAGRDVGGGADGGGRGHPGQQRQPAAPRRRHPSRAQQHRDHDRGPRRADPLAAQPAPPGQLLLGGQHRALGSTGGGPDGQVGVGRSGGLDDRDLPPEAARADQAAPERVGVEGRAVLRLFTHLGHHCAGAGAGQREGPRVTRGAPGFLLGRLVLTLLLVALALVAVATLVLVLTLVLVVATLVLVLAVAAALTLVVAVLVAALTALALVLAVAALATLALVAVAALTALALVPVLALVLAALVALVAAALVLVLLEVVGGLLGVV